MPTYHSSFNEASGNKCCSTIILPLKTKLKGPAPKGKGDEPDIIDEAIRFFRANVLHRKYKSKGPADLTICYLTVFISEVLRLLAPQKTRMAGEKKITEISMKANFAIPGESKFPLAGFFGQPESRNAAEQFRQYFRQLREETCMRMLDIVYNSDGSFNKWWFQFSKRKFMNIASTS